MNGEVREVTLILTTNQRIGQGVEGDPIRVVRQLWTHDGELVGEFDSVGGEQEPRGWWSGEVGNR